MRTREWIGLAMILIEIGVFVVVVQHLLSKKK
jgi:hypothetical protein